MREKLMQKIIESDIFICSEIEQLDSMLKWFGSDYIQALVADEDCVYILDTLLYAMNTLEFVNDENLVEEKRKYRKNYCSFFAKYEELLGQQQSILILYKPISVEYRHYFCFSEGFYIRSITNLTPIPKSKKKDVAKELLRVLLKNKSFRYKNNPSYELFLKIKITPEELLEYCR